MRNCNYTREPFSAPSVSCVIKTGLATEGTESTEEQTRTCTRRGFSSSVLSVSSVVRFFSQAREAGPR